jgi:hypothetical protein
MATKTALRDAKEQLLDHEWTMKHGLPDGRNSELHRTRFVGSSDEYWLGFDLGRPTSKQLHAQNPQLAARMSAGQAAVWKTSDMATDDQITECLTTYG